MTIPSPIASALIAVCILSTGPQPAPTQAQPAPVPTPQAAAPSSEKGGEVTEEELKRDYIGKPLFLRGSYLGDSISFTEHGEPTGHPAKGSYTLSGIQIEKVRLTKHKVEFEGARYAMHFLGAMPYEDPNSAVDRVKITPKKKVLKITIDREQVVKPKKEKQEKGKPAPKPSTAPKPDNQPAASAATSASEPEEKEPAQAAEPASEQAADPASVTTTLSPAHAAHMLREALDKVFATGLDERVKAQMPPFWQLYYQAQAAGVDYRPSDPAVLRSNAVDQQAKLTGSIAPDSNEYAQTNGIAGRALYRAVIGPDGKPAEIAVVRPIGFGLDENAVAAIRKASFQPAIKAGAPVAETLDLAVLFRIYSKRTSVAAADPGTSEPGAAPKPAAAIKPGPFTVRAPQSQPAPSEAAPVPQPDSAQPPPQDAGTDGPAIVIPADPVKEAPATPETKPDPKPADTPKPPATNQT